MAARSLAKDIVGAGCGMMSKAVLSVHDSLPETPQANLELILNKVWAKSNQTELRILVTGKRGQGKSTLINGILGAVVAVEGAGAKRCTTEVEMFSKSINEVPVRVFDSPGLQDRTQNEDEYINKMREKCKELSLVIYCTKMTNPRLGDDDKHAMSKLTKVFGENFWEYAVFVLTFANMEDCDRRDDRDEDKGPQPKFADKIAWGTLRTQRFKGRLRIWGNELKSFLTNEVGVKPEIANKIPVVPTGDHLPTPTNPYPNFLPDRYDWFSKFWEACCLRVKATQLFLKINEDRLVAEDDDGTDQHDDGTDFEEICIQEKSAVIAGIQNEPVKSKIDEDCGRRSVMSKVSERIDVKPVRPQEINEAQGNTPPVQRSFNYFKTMEAKSNMQTKSSTSTTIDHQEKSSMSPPPKPAKKATQKKNHSHQQPIIDLSEEITTHQMKSDTQEESSDLDPKENLDNSKREFTEQSPEPEESNNIDASSGDRNAAHIDRKITITNEFVEEIVTENARRSENEEAVKKSKNFFKHIKSPAKWFVNLFKRKQKKIK